MYEEKRREKMRGWVIKLLVVLLCLGMAAPVIAADQGESVWSKYNMKLYGRVKMDYIHATGRSSAGTVATNKVDRREVSDQDNSSTDFKAKDTRFGFISSHESGDWVGKGRFEIDFFGSDAGASNQPRFRLGYIDLANKDWGTSFRFGKDWQPISQLHPSTIDFGILLRAGNLWERPEQFTVRQKAADNLELLGTLFLFRRASTADETQLPWVAVRAAYTFEALDGKHMLAVFGGFQKDEQNGTQEDIDRYVVGLEMKFNLGPVLLKGEAWYGEAVGSHFSRSEALAVANNPVDASDLQEVAAWGGWIDLTYKIKPTWSVTAGVGIDDPDEDDFQFGPNRVNLGNSNFTQNVQTYLNSWYSITPAIKLGAEWMWVNTEREEGIGDPNPGNSYTGSYNQFLISAFYNF
jgi:hypothetical protein